MSAQIPGSQPSQIPAPLRPRSPERRSSLVFLIVAAPPRLRSPVHQIDGASPPEPNLLFAKSPPSLSSCAPKLFCAKAPLCHSASSLPGSQAPRFITRHSSKEFHQGSQPQQQQVITSAAATDPPAMAAAPANARHDTNTILI